MKIVKKLWKDGMGLNFFLQYQTANSKHILFTSYPKLKTD